MLYQTLYRAWRPQSFSDMVGQSAVVNTLRNQIITGHISHAYLFCGTRGTGKTSAARILSMAINCESPENGDPCLKCESCLTLQKDASLDVFEMDAASNSRVEEIREMLEKTNYPPQQAKYKVYIIDEVHMLSNAAFNALLKTLEEPPAYMVFILATTEPQKLPATILSRCQRFDFGRISKDDIANRLKMALDNTKFDESAVQLIAAAAEGSMRDAWSLLDMCLQPGQELTEEHVRTALGTVSKEFLYDFFDAIAKRNMRDVLELTDKLMASGKDIQVFLRSFSQHLRDIMYASFDTDSSADERIRLQAEQISPIRLTLLIEQCMKAESEAKWSTSPKILLEAFALRACLEQTDTDDILALSERIEQLEQKIESLIANGISLKPEKKYSDKNSLVNASSVLENESDAAQTVAPASKSKQKKLNDAQKNSELQTESEAFPKAKQEAESKADAEHAKSAPEAPSDISKDNIVEKQEASVLDAEFHEKNEQFKTKPEDAWNNMLKRAQKELTSSYGIIQQGKYGGFSNGRFTLLYEAGKEAYLDFINDLARKDAIEKLLSEELGAPAGFEARLEKSKGKSIDKQKQTQKDIEQLSAFVGRENIVLKE
jgi:DNA polymerase-3 subunit gamma/tau